MYNDDIQKGENLMKSILQELYEDGLRPSEEPKRYLEKSAELKKEHFALYEALIESLSEKQRSQFCALWDQLFEGLGYTGCESFICGFQLGARIMLEVMDAMPTKVSA